MLDVVNLVLVSLLIPLMGFAFYTMVKDHKFDWKVWNIAYHLGADSRHFKRQELCRCGHRSYLHDYIRKVQTSDWALLRPCMEKCEREHKSNCTSATLGGAVIPCACTQFSEMSPFEFIEYVKPILAYVKIRSATDFNDYEEVYRESASKEY